MSIIVKVMHDDSAESPRAMSNMGTMACWHRRYNLGDVQPKESPEEWIKANAPKGSIVLPLYLYDHSGISMRTNPFSCPWDSGQVGVIVATPAVIREWLGVKRITKKIRKRATEALVAEVKTYDDYLTGNVWGYTIEAANPCGECGTEHPKEIEDGSCWGFYGDDALADMKSYVDPKYHDALEQAWDNRM